MIQCIHGLLYQEGCIPSSYSIAEVQVWLIVRHLKCMIHRPMAQELGEPDALFNVESRVRPRAWDENLRFHPAFRLSRCTQVSTRRGRKRNDALHTRLAEGCRTISPPTCVHSQAPWNEAWPNAIDGAAVLNSPLPGGYAAHFFLPCTKALSALACDIPATRQGQGSGSAWPEW